MDRGIQIIYVPTHAEGDINHPDCETGFITSVVIRKPVIERLPVTRIAFCRYWNKSGELRTKANSEATPIESLVVKDTVPQAKVRKALQDIESGFKQVQSL
jgi:hypothetical protein